MTMKCHMCCKSHKRIKQQNGSLYGANQIFCFELCKHNKSNLYSRISKTKSLFYVVRDLQNNVFLLCSVMIFMTQQMKCGLKE